MTFESAPHETGSNDEREKVADVRACTYTVTNMADTFTHRRLRDLVDNVCVDLLDYGAPDKLARVRRLEYGDTNLRKAVVIALAEGFAIQARVAQSGSMPSSYRGIAMADAEALVVVRLARDRVLAVRGRGRPQMGARATMADSVMPSLRIKAYLREQERKSKNPVALRSEFESWEGPVREFGRAAGIGDKIKAALHETRAFVERTLAEYEFDGHGFSRVTKLHRETGTKWDPEGYGRTGYHRDTNRDRAGYDRRGYDRDGYRRDGYDVAGRDRQGFDRAGFDRDGYDHRGFDRDGRDRDGRDWQGRDREGYDRNGFDHCGYDKNGLHRNGTRFDDDGFDRQGLDSEGFGRSGYDREGRDREGRDKDGRDRDGFDRKGVDKDGYDRDGFRPEPSDIYGTVVFRDREGFDRDGFDKDGFGRDGYDRRGRTRDGRDRDGNWVACDFCGVPISGGRWREIVASGTKRRTCSRAHTQALRQSERAAKTQAA